MHKKIKFCMQKSFFFEKCLFAYKIRFAVEKKNKKKFGANIQNIYGNCMESIFPVLKKPHKWVNFFSIVFRK